MKICSIKDCNNEMKSRGWCDKHYRRWYEHGNPDFTLQYDCKGKICMNCKKPARKKGLCNSHYTKLWRTENPILARKNMLHSWSQRSVRKKNAKGTHTRFEWEELLIKFNYICAYCKKNEANSKDHIIPLYNGGTNNIDNILPACRSCNSSKHIKPLNEWLSTKGYSL